MAAVAVSPLLQASVGADDVAALEHEAHGRARDASRTAESWAGVVLSLRMISLRQDAANTTSDRALARLMDRVVSSGLVDAVVEASVDAVMGAASRGAKQVLVHGDPAGVQSVRVAAPSLAIERLFVVGRIDATSDDPLNALADLAIGAPVSSTAPWAIVRNSRGRALLDALDAEIWLDAVPRAVFRAAADAVTVAGQNRRPQVVP